MTHFTVAVIIEPEYKEAPEERVAELMSPYYEGDEWFADGSRWDWWVIGGRWDGAIRGLEWRPLYETCFLCEGTGKRKIPWPDDTPQEWIDETKGCNGCNGTGKTEGWPTGEHYQSLERNMCLMSEVAEGYTPSSFVPPTGEWMEAERMGWFGSGMPDENGLTAKEKVGPFDQGWAEAREKYADYYVVGIDAHV